MSSRRIAVVGGGISGVTAAWQMAQFERARGGLEVVLFEASGRLGGIVETVLRDGFVIECGPDGWVSEKPWARELVRELGMQEKLVGSNDGERVTWIVQDGRLVAMPAGMRMMVPTDLEALEGSPLFSAEAIAAYAAEPARAEELRASAPKEDESIASFVRRHFGDEVLTKVAAPLLSGVFGGDVARLSVRAVMPGFVRMEQEYGSLMEALRGRDASAEGGSIFTSLELGTQSLVDRMVSELPPDGVRLGTAVTSIARAGDGWEVRFGDGCEGFDQVILATPAHVTRELLAPVDARLAELHEMEASSAVVVALAFEEWFPLPKGFGFLVPAGERSRLLAGTFVDQKYPGRVPEGGRLLRGFFGDPAIAEMGDEEIAELALAEMQKLVGALPRPSFYVVRRWMRSLPQYGVGHLERVAEVEMRMRGVVGLHLVGNGYRGVGLPDLVRAGRAVGREVPALTA